MAIESNKDEQAEADQVNRNKNSWKLKIIKRHWRVKFSLFAEIGATKRKAS